MSGQLGFIDLDGDEIANAYRTRSYILNGLAGGAPWVLTDRGCSILAREVGGVGPFVSPSADPAPWYDASVAESAEFLGLYITDLDFQTVDVRRSISQRFGGISGGVIGFEQVAARGVYVKAWLIASSCPGMEYGRHWIYSKLGADCEGCALGTLRVRDSCPPDDGSDDTRGERVIYDAALVDGIKRFDNPGFPCCDYDPLEFTLAGQSPYLYSRAGAATSPVEVQSNAGIIPPIPATLDTFVRANTGPPPSASWTGTTYLAETNTLRVLSNLLNNSSAPGAGTTGSAHWNAATFGPDVTVGILVPTRVASGRFEIRARLVTPGTSTATGVFCRIIYGASSDSIHVGRVSATLGTSMASNPGQTFASGDTYALVCRGNVVEGWRKPSGSGWVRLVAMYDPTTPVAGNVGVAITQQGATQDLSTMTAGTLTNGVYPVDVVTIPIPATSIGITSPIVTLATDQALEWSADSVIANDIRIQLKQYANCSETDDFAADDLLTRWVPIIGASAWTISGGKLRPSSITTQRVLARSTDGTLAGRVVYGGGRVEATIKTGAVLTNGVWGVGFSGVLSTGAFGFLVASDGTLSNVFKLANGSAGVTYDSTALTPVASTTYRIITELLPLANGDVDARAYIMDQAAPTVMLTRPLRATLTGGQVESMWVPAFDTRPAATTEEWDSFSATDYSDSASYLDASIPAGTLIVDGSRRVAQFTPIVGASVDGSQYLSTPPETPLGWPDVCAGAGQGCLQIFGSEAPYPGTTVSVALQSRVR